MKRFILVLPLLVSGCAIANRSDKFGADLEIGIGGLLSYVADLHLKASVGFSKTCPDPIKSTGKAKIETEATDAEHAGAGDSDPLGIDHFL